MTFPANATKVNLDQATDDPKLARDELADLVDKFNTLLGHFPGFAQTLVSRSTAALMRIDLGVAVDIIASGTVSNAASLDFTDLSADYRAYKLVFDNLVPVTDATVLWLRTDTNNGLSFETSGYAHARVDQIAAGDPPDGAGSNSDVAIILSSDHDDGANSVATGTITIYNPMNSGSRTQTTAAITFVNSTGSIKFTTSGGTRAFNEAHNAIQIKFSAGNISKMNYTLYGLRAS